MATDPGAGTPRLDELLELTERALASSLDEALAWVRAQLTARIGDAAGGPEVERALDIAVASATRALAARDADAASVAELRSQARLDDLTGVLNRRAFFQQLDDELDRSQRTASPVTLVLCDVDGLKAINDAHGHPAGDEALRSLSALLERNVRASDFVGRIGGDEFGVILVATEAAATERIVERLTETVGTGEVGAGEVGASFGIARAPEDGVTRDALVAAADERLYGDKRTR